MARFALRRILMFDAASCAISGAKLPAQEKDNARAADFPPLSDEIIQAVRELYESRVQSLVHHY